MLRIENYLNIISKGNGSNNYGIIIIPLTNLIIYGSINGSNGYSIIMFFEDVYSIFR